MNSSRSLGRIRATTAARLRARQEEIHRTIIHRALSVAPPSGREAPGYVEGLRAAIPSVVEHAFKAIELGEDRLGPLPAAIFSQAGAAAQSEVGLEVVLRRYASGYSALSEFLHQEVQALAGNSHSVYPVLHRELTALFDRVVVEVSEAYRRAEDGSTSSPRRRRIARIRRLLAGDLVDTSALDYELEGWHLALIARCPDGIGMMRELGSRLDRRLLAVEVDETTMWAWFGGRRPFGDEELESFARHDWPDRALVVAGRPGHELAGWRRTHRQASAALSVAVLRPRAFTAYEDIALPAALLRDEDLVTYLEESILTPLADNRGGGETLRETLQAHFASGENVSSAASLLGVSRQTIAARLRVAEEILGRTITSCRAEIEAALSVEDFRR